MIEIEIKIPIEDSQYLEKQLNRIGFERGASVEECDIYYNSGHFDLREKDMALRVRSCIDRISGNRKSMITYKGPKLDNKSMTRRELETGIEDAQICNQLIQALGFYALPEVKKSRQYYHLDRMTACIDQVEKLGEFLELEILAEEDCMQERELERVYSILAELGLNPIDTIRTSYLSMLCEREKMENGL